MNSSLTFDVQHRFNSDFELDIQFEAGNGVTALFGPSGSGKSSILAAIAGLLKPQHGLIKLEGEVITDTCKGVFLPPEKRRVGVLFQDYCLFPHLSVRDNLAFGRRRRPDNGVDLDRIIKVLELTHILNRFPRTLSGGQQERVALARALAAAPRLLVLDEPLTAVEDALSLRITQLIERMVCEFSIPTILISHNRELVNRLATRFIQVACGRVLEQEDNERDDAPHWPSIPMQAHRPA